MGKKSEKMPSHTPGKNFFLQNSCIYEKFVVTLQPILKNNDNESETICQMGGRKDATH